MRDSALLASAAPLMAGARGSAAAPNAQRSSMRRVSSVAMRLLPGWHAWRQRGGLDDRGGLSLGERRGFAAGRHADVIVAELARAAGQLAVNLDHQHADVGLLGVR